MKIESSLQRSPLLVLTTLLVLGLLSGCERRVEESEKEEGKKTEKTEEKGYSFEPDKGLKLNPEAEKEMNLKTSTATSKLISGEFLENVQIFQESTEKHIDTSITREGFAYGSVRIPQERVFDFKIGDPVRLDLKHADKIVEGKIFQIDHQLQDISGEIEVVVEIPDAQHSLNIGTTLQIAFKTRHESKGIIIPRTALLNTTEGDCVYVHHDDFYHRSPVKVGSFENQIVQIKEGLNDGDVVVSEGAEQLWILELKEIRGTGGGN